MDAERTRSPLEREAAALLSRWDPEAVERVDAILSDCAAEAVQLTIARLDVERELDAMVCSDAAAANRGERQRELLLRRRRLTARRTRIDQLMGSLRVHRDRIAPR